MTGEPSGRTGRARERSEALTALTGDPRPAVSRAALAAQHPAWGVVTLSLLAVGVVVGFLSLSTWGAAADACRSEPTLLVCRPRVHATVVALPVTALLVGLTVCLIGGRLVAGRGRSPLPVAAVGWAVFGLATLVAYLLVSAR